MSASVAAVVVAAGRGLRAGGDLPKQYRKLAGEPVIRSSLSLFSWHGQIGAVQAVIHPDDRGNYEAAASGLRLMPPVLGGATRQASVRAGLEALSARAPDIVLVHDAARPFCSVELVSRAITACSETGAAIPALEVTDTIKRIDADGRVAGTVDRTPLRAVQTPQAFAFGPLLDAHRRAAKEGRDDFTDDAALAEWAGLKVAVFAGESGNVKMTTEEDFAKAEARRIAGLADLRLGNGFDVHSFGDGDHVWLGGLKIPHDRGLTGHSDADVALHAIVDAILGAIADGDIGKHFSPNDPRWKGASSDQFLKFAIERVTKRGGKVAHLDLTIVCEEPRIGPHRDAMRKRIAEIAEISIDRVAVKATTSEQLGFTGRKEGIVAMATATVRLPLVLVMADAETQAAAVALLDLCKAKKLMVATAESCTGGLVAGALTDIAGSSAVVDRGFVTYTNEAKHQMLGVPTETLNSFGAVSRQTAEAMARGALGHANADIVVAITGIAGPGGGSAEKPVGLVHFAAASRGGALNHRERRYGEIGRAEVRRLSVLEALAMLTELAAR